MIDDDKRIMEILNQLKNGTILMKRKIDGKKFPRRFFLDKDEGFISYEKSRRVFVRPKICKYHFGMFSQGSYQSIVDSIKDINEVRSGFRAQTFGELLKNGLITTEDVRI